MKRFLMSQTIIKIEQSFDDGLGERIVFSEHNSSLLLL